jgi:Zincin-like metallopeptidase
VHWTRHPSRLAREFGRKRFGDEGYAMEELVAELGAAFLCADLDLTPEVRDDHAAYIASWIKVLKNDKRAIFTAASHAQRAVDFLHGLQEAPAVPLVENFPNPSQRQLVEQLLDCAAVPTSLGAASSFTGVEVPVFLNSIEFAISCS